MLSSTRLFKGNGKSRSLGAVEQVVVEADVELRPGEDQEAHAGLDEAAQALRLLGRRGGDVGQDEHVGGVQPLRQEIVILDDLDAPGFRRADADRQGGGQVVDLGAERLRSTARRPPGGSSSESLTGTAAQRWLSPGSSSSGSWSESSCGPDPGNGTESGTRAV